MTKQVRLRRGSTAQVDAFTGAVGEIVIDTTRLEIRLQNGVAAGLRVPRFGGSFGADAGTAALPSIFADGDPDTGTFFPAANTWAVATAGIRRFEIDPAGNAGLGVTPFAWRSTQKAIDIGGTFAGISGASNTLFYTNVYTDSGNIDRYKQNGFASVYAQLSGGSHVWSSAPSGTAGNPITFNQAMTLFQSANLSLGGTVDVGEKIQINALPSGAANSQLSINSATTAKIFFNTPISSGVGSSAAGDLLFFAAEANTERARTTSAGYFKASNTGTYNNAAAPYHEVRSNQNDATLFATNTNTGSSVTNVLSGLASGSAGYHFEGLLNDVAVYRVLANGNVQNTNNSYGAISDAKLKNLITPRDGNSYWEKFKQIKFWIYSLKSDPTNQQLLGVVAQELQEIFPGLIQSSTDMHEVTKTRTVTTERQVTEPVQQEQTRTEIALENGRYVQKTITQTVIVEQPVFDEFPLYDENGAPVMQLVRPEVLEETDEDGNIIVEAQLPLYEPAMHKVPRMETVETVEEYTEMEPTGEVTLAVNYSILGLIADTITQELQNRVDDLTARVAALESN